MLSKDLAISIAGTKLYLTDTNFNTIVAEYSFGANLFPYMIEVDIKKNIVWVIVGNTNKINFVTPNNDALFVYKFKITENLNVFSFGSPVFTVQIPDGAYIYTDTLSNIVSDDYENVYFVLSDNWNAYYCYHYRLIKLNSIGTATIKSFGYSSLSRYIELGVHNGRFNLEFDKLKNILIMMLEGAPQEANGIYGANIMFVNPNNFNDITFKAINGHSNLTVNYNTQPLKFLNYALSQIDLKNRKLYMISRDSLTSELVFSETDIDTFNTVFITNRHFSNNIFTVDTTNLLWKDFLTGEIRYYRRSDITTSGLYSVDTKLSINERNNSFIDMKNNFIFNPMTNEFIEFIKPNIIIHNAANRNDVYITPCIIPTDIIDVKLLPSSFDSLDVYSQMENKLVFPTNGGYIQNGTLDFVFKTAKILGNETQQFRICITSDKNKLINLQPTTIPSNLELTIDSYDSGQFFNAFVEWSYCTDFNSYVDDGYDISQNGAWARLGTDDSKTINGLEPTNGILNNSESVTKYVRVKITDPALIESLDSSIFIKIFSNIKK